jgi:hypothetical protein
LGTTATNQNFIQEEIKGRLNLGNACYHPVQNLLSTRLLSNNIKIRIQKTTILPVVLYGRETWSLALKEEHRLRVFENRMLRRIFGPKRDEVTGGWRKLHYEYSSPNIITIIKYRRVRWAELVARMGEKRSAYRILVGKSERKTPVGRPRRGWVNNSKMDLRNTEWGGMDWNDLAQELMRALVNTIMKLGGSTKCWEILE